MISIKRDDKGDMVAVCEYLFFDENKIVSSEGKTLFIGDMVINKAYENNGVLKYFIKEMLKIDQWVECGWFRQLKYKDRPVRMYKREQFEKLIKE